jgi:hypothetical protein
MYPFISLIGTSGLVTRCRRLDKAPCQTCIELQMLFVNSGICNLLLYLKTSHVIDSGKSGTETNDTQTFAGSLRELC